MSRHHWCQIYASIDHRASGTIDMKSRKYCEVWKEDTSSEMVMWQAPGATCDVCDGRCDAESDVGLHMTQLLTPPLHKYHILNIFDVIWAKIPHPPSYKPDKIRVYQQHITFLSQGFLENWEMHQNILDFWYSLIKFKILLDQRTEALWDTGLGCSCPVLHHDK